MPKINRLDRFVERADIVDPIDRALLPVGSIISINPGHYSNGTNGAFTSVLGSNDVATLKTWLLNNYPHWWLCDGTIPNDASSPIWNTASLKVPEMTSRRFLRGASVAGGGQTTANNKPSVTI